MAWSCAAYGVTLVCVASENEENVKKRKPVKRAKRGKSTKRAKTGETGKYERGTRSYTMSRIRGKDTKIEVLVRSYLFRRGLRFRKNDKRYPGHPDVVLPKYHVIVFVNGCFWHMHERCGNHSMPKSNVNSGMRNCCATVSATVTSIAYCSTTAGASSTYGNANSPNRCVRNGSNGCIRRSSTPTSRISTRPATGDGHGTIGKNIRETAEKRRIGLVDYAVGMVSTRAASIG